MALIRKSDIESILTSLQSIYSIHDLKYGTFTLNQTMPKHSDLVIIKSLFDTAYAEEHLTNCIRWTSADEDITTPALLKQSMLNEMNASIVSMQAMTHYSRTVNTAGTTYNQTTNTASTSYSQLYNGSYTSSYSTTFGFGSAGYGQWCPDGAGYNQTAYTAGTSYTQTSNTAGTTYTES